jgi:hypothetical protein
MAVLWQKENQLKLDCMVFKPIVLLGVLLRTWQGCA